VKASASIHDYSLCCAKKCIHLILLSFFTLTPVGKVTTRLVQLKAEAEIYLRERNSNLLEVFDSACWMAKLANLSNIFSILNELNLSLRQWLYNIFAINDITEVFKKSH
jgi:hypothetical protein